MSDTKEAVEFQEFSGPDSTPTEAEVLLIEACRDGLAADCAEIRDSDELTVSGALIAALATGRFKNARWSDWGQHPDGLILGDSPIDRSTEKKRVVVDGPIILRRSVISGPFILNDVHLPIGFDAGDARFAGLLNLDRCVIDGELTLDDTRIEGQFSASNAKFRNEGGRAIWAQAVYAKGWYMRNAHVDGSLDIYGGNIDGQFSVNNAKFRHKDDVAIQADAVSAKDWFMDRAELDGAFEINGATIDGQFSANDSKFHRKGDLAIRADTVSAKDWFMDRAEVDGAFNIYGATIDGQFSASEAKFCHRGDPAIRADGVSVKDWLMDVAEVDGAFHINSAKIDGQFSAFDAKFRHEGDLAIRADMVSATDWLMRRTEVDGEFDINGATIEGRFVANGAKFSNEGGRAVLGQTVSTRGWFMRDAEIDGAFNINGAIIEGQFSANGTVFRNKGDLAIGAQAVSAKDWLMRNVEVNGSFEINSATINGQFSANGAKFCNEGGRAIWAQTVFANGWLMRDAEVDGAFDIASATIGGHFSATGAKFRNRSGYAFRGQEIRVGSMLFSNTTIEGHVILLLANVGGALVVRNGTRITAEPGLRAINASGATIEGGVRFVGGVAGDVIIDGEANFDNAVIRNTFDASGAVMRAGYHRALSLRNTTVEADIVFSGAKIKGHVALNRARVTGRVNFETADLTASTANINAKRQLPLLTGNARDVDMQDRFRDHALVMVETRIEGRLVLPNRQPLGLIDLSRARCDTLEDYAYGWPPPLERGARRAPKIDCLGPGNATQDSDRRASVRDGDGRLNAVQGIILDGFVYDHLEYPGGTEADEGDIGRARKRWLAGQPETSLVEHFNPQPWRQCAHVLRAMGYDVAAQQVSIERRVRQRHADGEGLFARLISWLLHVTADYGFNPWKAVIWSIGIVAICALFFHHADAVGRSPDQQFSSSFDPVRVGDVQMVGGEPDYPAFEPFLYSLDNFVPLLDLGAASFWSPNLEAGEGAPFIRIGKPWDHGETLIGISLGMVLYLLVILQRIAGALLIAIAITGFTGILTRDER